MSRDDEQVWAELVESFNSPTDAEKKAWPAAENVDPEVSGEASTDATHDGSTDPTHDGSDNADAPSGEPRRSPPASDPEEHFVPPNPPPLPSTDLITRAAWAGVLGTPVAFTAAVLLGASISGWTAAIGVAAFVGGFAILISRLKGHDPYDPDDGAVV